MEYILSVLSGGTSGAIVIWLMKNLIAERVKQSIKAEYDEILERLKTSLAFREKALDTLIQVSGELSNRDDLSSAIEALQTKNQKAVMQYIGERKDEYSTNYDAYRKIRYLFDEKAQEQIDVALAKTDSNNAQVGMQLIDGPDNTKMPELINQFLTSSSEFRDLFIRQLNDRIDYLSKELLGSSSK